MKKVNLRSLGASILLIFALIFSFGFTSSPYTKLDVILNAISFELNGEPVTAGDQDHQYYNGKEYVPESIVYKGTTYIPIRFAGDLLSADVNWDAETHTVEITHKGADDVVNPQDEEFKVIEYSSLTDEEKEFVERVKKVKGVHQINNLVVIAAGEKPNPGYGIEYVKQQTSWEQLKVFVKLTKPDPDRMYPQVIAYPFFLARMNLPPYTTISFVNVDTGKELFANEEILGK